MIKKLKNCNTIEELDSLIERAEMFITRTNDDTQKKVWRDRLGSYFQLLQSHEDYRELKRTNK